MCAITRLGTMAMIASILACRGQLQAPAGRASLTAVNASYTPVTESDRGVLAFDLIIRNEDNVPARLGCGISINRKDTSGIKAVVYGACLAAQSASTAAERNRDIQPQTSDTLRITRNISLRDFAKDATFGAALSITFGPSFKTGLPFKSNWFKPIELPEQDIGEIRRLLSNTR